MRPGISRRSTKRLKNWGWYLQHRSAAVRVHKPSALTTSSVGYVRLHGRNYENWFRDKAVRDDRYNYLYSLEQLEPWIANIQEVARHTKETYVITNNHFRGKAVVNALEIKSTLGEKKVLAPGPLFTEYPRLADSATPETETTESEGNL